MDTKYTEPQRIDGYILCSIAQQDGLRQLLRLKDTLSNWQFAWYLYHHDR